MIAALPQHRRLLERRPGSERFADTVGIGCIAPTERRPRPADELSPQLRLDTGVWLERQGRLKEAAACFQSAIACAPVHMGVTDGFAAYLLDGQSAPRDSAELVVQAYARLAGTLQRLGRADDAALAEEAARRFIPDGAGSAPILSMGDRRQKGTLHAVAPPSFAGDRRPDISGVVTVLIVTHLTCKLKRNAHLSPPDTGLVAATYDSALEVFGKGLGRCPKQLWYDSRPETGGDAERAEYGRRLERFARARGFAFRRTPGVGLLKTLDCAVREVKTPLLLFLEHDWRFVGPAVELSGLAQVFGTHPYVHSIRFNKRPNRVSNFDFLLEREERIAATDLLRTPAVSNNPSLVRVDTLRSLWLPACLADPLVRSSDLAGHSFGVEEPLFKRQMKEIRTLGFSRAHARWGTYLYGGMNAPARIEHLGE